MSGPPPRHPAAQIVIKVYEDGAMSVDGPMDERAWVIACLRNAVDAVAAHRQPKLVKVSGRDVDLGTVLPAALTGKLRDDGRDAELAGVLRALFGGTDLQPLGAVFANMIDPRHDLDVPSDYNRLLKNARGVMDQAGKWHRPESKVAA